MLTAAYAALAGLVVTFLVGYPLTLSTALITISLVCASALLTARVVAPPAENTADAGVAQAPEGRRAISRRRFIGWTGGAVVMTAAGAGTGLSFLSTESVTVGGGPGRSSRAAVSVADLRGSGSPAPGGTVRRHVLTAKKATVRLPSGREIDAWTYNGEVPGPAITATQGDLIEVRLRNADIEDGVTLHWHGYDVPCGEDGAPGVTQMAVGPGEDFVYRFRADQLGTYWYTHHASHVGVDRGLYGTLVVKPRDGQRADEHSAAEQVDLTLPVHTFDGTAVIAGRDGQTEHPAPPGTPVRLRLINTDSDPHRIVVAGTPFRMAAVDGRDSTSPARSATSDCTCPQAGDTTWCSSCRTRPWHSLSTTIVTADCACARMAMPPVKRASRTRPTCRSSTCCGTELRPPCPSTPAMPTGTSPWSSTAQWPWSTANRRIRTPSTAEATPPSPTSSSPKATSSGSPSSTEAWKRTPGTCTAIPC